MAVLLITILTRYLLALLPASPLKYSLFLVPTSRNGTAWRVPWSSLFILWSSQQKLFPWLPAIGCLLTLWLGTTALPSIWLNLSIFCSSYLPVTAQAFPKKVLERAVNWPFEYSGCSSEGMTMWLCLMLRFNLLKWGFEIYLVKVTFSFILSSMYRFSSVSTAKYVVVRQLRNHRAWPPSQLALWALVSSSVKEGQRCFHLGVMSVQCLRHCLGWSKCLPSLVPQVSQFPVPFHLYSYLPVCSSGLYERACRGVLRTEEMWTPLGCTWASGWKGHSWTTGATALVTLRCDRRKFVSFT